MIPSSSGAGLSRGGSLMKKIFAVLLALSLLLGAFSVASAAGAGAPKIQKQPTSQTTDKKGKVTFSFRATNFSPEESSWHFIDPATGREYTGPELREAMAEVKGFKLTVSNGKQVLTLTGVPESMHGWEVFVRLVNKGYEIDTDHVRLWYYGLDQTDEPSAPAGSETGPSGNGTENETGNGNSGAGDAPEELAGAGTITVTASKATLYPLDSDGNPLEDQGASSLTFVGSGSVAVRSDREVQYWTVNGIRIEPMSDVTGFVLKNITSDLSISAKYAKSASSADEIDPDNPCMVTCTGCIFTYHAGGLRSVSSGEVPCGATITVFCESTDAAAKGYRINGGEPEHAGSASFRLKIEDDTVITCP